jgi:hypothetical protein
VNSVKKKHQSVWRTGWCFLFYEYAVAEVLGQFALYVAERYVLLHYLVAAFWVVDD